MAAANTSTSTGNKIGGNIGSFQPLNVQPFPLSNTALTGPMRLRQTHLVKNLNQMYTDQDKYSISAGNIPLTWLGAPSSSSWTVNEYGDNAGRMTILTANTPIVIPVASGAAALGVGTAVYSFPAGLGFDLVLGGGATMQGSVQASVTPGTASLVTGLGTTIASGVIAVLAAAMRNVIGQNTCPNANSTQYSFPDSIAAPLIGAAATQWQVFLNFANTWAASDTLTIPVGFKIIFNWKPLGAIEQSGYTFV